MRLYTQTSSGITVGTTPISGGTNPYILYNNAGVVGNIQVIPIANGGTNNSSSYTAGSVIFSNGTSLTQDNSNFFWDDTNNRLGVGIAAPSTTVDIFHNSGGTSSAKSFNVGSDYNTNSFYVTAQGDAFLDGRLWANNYPSALQSGSAFGVQNAAGYNIKFGTYSGVNLIESINDAGNADVPLYLYASDLFLWTSVGVGYTSLPASTRFSVKGSGATSATYSMKVQNSASADIFALRDDKVAIAQARFTQTQGADVASVAGAIALGFDGNVFEITGTNAITLISNVGWQNGSEVTLIFTSTATLTNGVATSGTDITMKLAGAANFVASADDSITLTLCEIGGTQAWREKCRSVN